MGERNLGNALVNQRYLETYFRLPEQFRSLDLSFASVFVLA